MQTVPSLVGVGTAVAAAATGLVFGQTLDVLDDRPVDSKYLASERDTSSNSRLESAPVISRPATSSAPQAPNLDNVAFNTLPHNFSLAPTTSAGPRLPRPLHTQLTPPKTHSRRHSFVRNLEHTTATINEDTRDSISSSGSWMRRLSIRPLSQHGSPRSSVGPDTSSLAFSHGSGAPILSPSNPVASLPPNKLVKRAPNSQTTPESALTRRRSRTHLPTLRRPATSHQRSATLQQFQNSHLGGSEEAPKYSLEQSALPLDIASPAVVEATQEAKQVSTWGSFFHSHATRGNFRDPFGRGLDGSPSTRSSLPSKRICVDTREKSAPYIVQPSMISGQQIRPAAQANSSPLARITRDIEESTPSPEDTPTKQARRSISMHFSSPSGWMNNKTGSIRRRQRGQESRPGGKRHVSAPVSAPQPPMSEEYNAAAEERLTVARNLASDYDSSLAVHTTNRKRNSSSPLPPLSRLSSFNIDLNKLGSSQSATSQHPRVHHQSGASQSSGLFMHFRRLSTSRSPTMDGSDVEGKDLGLGEDYDTDFKSETMYDSIRTVASGQGRTIETPVESMFDESPPSTAGNATKTKRLSIQEILGRWDGETRITEEDEGNATPIRTTCGQRSGLPSRHGSVEAPFAFEGNPDELALEGRDFSRLSLDDDLDDDWTKDDDVQFVNRLSPPNSINARAVSPNARSTLAGMGGNEAFDAQHSDVGTERPLSNLFDWSEPSTQDKLDGDGISARPKTVHGKQEIDLRGGRTAVRKGPTPSHIRSQSVPVAHDPSENGKANQARYGTWGLSSKSITEDWDDDFDFDDADQGQVDIAEKNGFGADKSLGMVVPASIQASQPSVKAHSGHIREFSLLVNDLKRLCRHGKDLNMLGGPQSPLWKEAEGIIALASPDEDDSGDASRATSTSRPVASIDGYFDEAFETEDKEKATSPVETRDLSVSKTAVIRERHTSRRRSVFSPDDDIFGGNWPAAEDQQAVPDRPRTPEPKVRNGQDINAAVRSVVEVLQNRSASDPSPLLYGPGPKVHFGSNSLKALVKRAGDLRDALSDIVRAADPVIPSPARTPRRNGNGSPAFTRVFTELQSTTPPLQLPNSRSSNSVLSRTSLDASPSNAVSQRMMMTTVS